MLRLRCLKISDAAAVFPLAFDIVVCAEDSVGGGSFGVKVLNFGIEAQGDSQKSIPRVSRVAFTIPIAYPLKMKSDVSDIITIVR